MSEGRSAGRFLIEAFVIVASILLAFGIDAWWDSRLERVEEREILAGLEREFTGYRDALDRRLVQHADMLSAMSAILAAIDDGEWTSTGWRMDHAIARLVQPPTSDLGNGVRDALVQAGRLEIVSDVELRERLAGWPGHYEEVLDDETFSRALVFERILPYLSRQGLDLAGVLIPGAVAADADESVWPVRVRRIGDDPIAARRLLSDPEFKSIVELRYAFWYHAGGEYRAAHAAAEEILDLLEEG